MAEEQRGEAPKTKKFSLEVSLDEQGVISVNGQHFKALQKGIDDLCMSLMGDASMGGVCPVEFACFVSAMGFHLGRAIAHQDVGRAIQTQGASALETRMTQVFENAFHDGVKYHLRHALADALRRSLRDRG